jgi:hypothetical protein
MSEVEKILSDPAKLREVASAAFNAVDSDKSGTLDNPKMIGFINNF